MGLSNGILRQMIHSHARLPWQGPVLTLGVQDIVSDYSGLTQLFKLEKVKYRPIPAEEQLRTTAHFFRPEQREARKYAHPRDFFRMLGIDEYDDLDFADFEKPTLIHDMNRPIPDEWRGKYGLIVDGGTIEHVFDLRAVFENIVNLLKVGGDVLHVAPTAGWVNHGFYQLNPCLFYDFYQSNGFDIRFAQVALLPKDPSRDAESMQTFEYTEKLMEFDETNHRMLFVFRATKRLSMPLQIPVQGCYRRFQTQEKKAV